MGAVEFVVRRHDHPRLRALQDGFKLTEIDLAQGALVDDAVREEAGVFLRVAGKVLDARPHALGLDALHHRRTEVGGENGIFRIIFKIAAA